MERVQPNRYLIWAGTVLVALVVVASVLSGRDVASFDPGSPESVAQQYVNAVFDGDVELARSLLSAEIAGECSGRELRHAWVPEEARVVLTNTTITDEVARVELEIIEPGGGIGLPVESYTRDVTLILTGNEDGWRISEAPWPIEYCDEGVRP